LLLAIPVCLPSGTYPLSCFPKRGIVASGCIALSCSLRRHSLVTSEWVIWPLNRPNISLNGLNDIWTAYFNGLTLYRYCTGLIFSRHCTGSVPVLYLMINKCL
jgi:hypothetical protein